MIQVSFADIEIIFSLQNLKISFLQKYLKNVKLKFRNVFI